MSVNEKNIRLENNPQKEHNVKRDFDIKLVLDDSMVFEILKEYEGYIPWQFGKIRDMDADTAREVLTLVLENN